MGILGMVMLTLNPLLQPAQQTGRYALFAHVDINNCYVSCETLFNSTLRGRAVVALSNNDGCMIAHSNEAKTAGIKMGDAEFMVRKQLKEFDAFIFSSNYVLYADMSAA